MKFGFNIYLVGVCIYGLFYYKIKTLLNSDLLLITVSVIYLLLLTITRFYVEKKSHNKAVKLDK
jgi:uncharacterized membrane protein YedE/YeeE